MLLLSLPLVLLATQDPDLSRRIEQLGDTSSETRAAATDEIEKKGPAAVRALLGAIDHADAEVRVRAKDILFRLEPTRFLDDLKKAQRPVQLGLPPEFRKSFPPAAVIDGGWFSMERKLWTEHRLVTGSVITTAWKQTMNGEVHWDVASVTASTSVPVQRCALHSPQVLFVPADYPGPVTVTIKGVRRWYCDVPVTFRFPGKADRRRVGPYTLTLDWPFVEIVGDDTAAAALGHGEVTCRLRPGCRAPDDSKQEPAQTEPGDEPAIFFPEAKEIGGGWCGCPTPRQAAAPSGAGGVLRRSRVALTRWSQCPLEDLASIWFEVHLPVDEPFEVTSAPLP